jgi:hypothetical protein
MIEDEGRDRDSDTVPRPGGYDSRDSSPRRPGPPLIPDPIHERTRP